MSNIDYSQLISAEGKAAEAAQAAEQDAKAECRRRIIEVCDETAQLNLTAACAAGVMTEAQLITYRIGLGWVAAMRATWPEIANRALDPQDDANWPVVPSGVAELLSSY